MNVYERLGVGTIINAKGPATRLSGGIMRPEVSQAMLEASQSCVDMAELQAAASREIAAATGAESGYVASGAAACLLLATAACVAGLDPGKMARLPDTRGMKNEVVMVRSQRNFYDHAVRAAGVKIIDVGLPDRYAGAGVRDAEAWEIDDAITENTAAFFYVADTNAEPALAEVVSAAHARGVPVIVDAAAQLPPQANLRSYISDGADLVVFSGGKALGGPQASGFLCGKRDLIMSAALQHLDLDIYADSWDPPPSLIDRNLLRGMPQHGIGRTCKVGKEEIIGLLTALRLFVEEGDAVRHKKWLAIVLKIASDLAELGGVECRVLGQDDITSVPTLMITFAKEKCVTHKIIRALGSGTPAIHVGASRREMNSIILSPQCLKQEEAPVIAAALVAYVSNAS